MKKWIITSAIAIAAIIGIITAIIIFNNIKKEQEEAIRLEQELNEQKEKAEQEEQEREELAQIEKSWEEIGDNQKYFELGSKYFYREPTGSNNDDNKYNYKWTAEFINALYMIDDGAYTGITKEHLNLIFNNYLNELPDKAPAKDVYSILASIANKGKPQNLKGLTGTDPLDGIITTDQGSEKNNDTGGNQNNKPSSGGSNFNSGGNNKDNNGNAPLPPGVEVSPDLGDPDDNYGGIYEDPEWNLRG